MKEVEQHFNAQLQALRSQGGSSAQEASKEQEIQDLDRKIQNLDTEISKAGGFFGGGKKKVQLQHERDECAQQRDELESQLMYIRQKGGAVVDPSQIQALESTKQADIAKRREGYRARLSEFEGTWLSKKEALTHKVKSEIAELEAQKESEAAQLGDNQGQRQELEAKKRKIEQELGTLS